MARRIFLVIAIVLATISLTGCPWPYGDLRPYVGRWENPDYDGDSTRTAVVVYADNDSGTVYMNTYDTIGDSFVMSLNGEWTESNGDYYANYTGSYAGGSYWHYLIRVSADGQTYEVNGRMDGIFPSAIDPSPTVGVYGIFTRV